MFVAWYTHSVSHSAAELWQSPPQGPAIDCVSDEKHACGEVCICTTRSDREVLVKHHARFRSHEAALRARSVCVSGRVFRSENLKNIFHHVVADELELFPLCQPLQSSCRCPLKFCGRVGVLSLCRRKCCRSQSFAFCKSGCFRGGNGAFSTCCRLLHVVRI